MRLGMVIMPMAVAIIVMVCVVVLVRILVVALFAMEDQKIQTERIESRDKNAR